MVMGNTTQYPNPKRNPPNSIVEYATSSYCRLLYCSQFKCTMSVAVSSKLHMNLHNYRIVCLYQFLYFLHQYNFESWQFSDFQFGILKKIQGGDQIPCR